MLTTGEKRFIKHWEEQREGGRTKYYLLYIPIGTFIATIVLSFVSLMFAFGFPNNLWLIIPGSFAVVTVSTVLSWWINEKKFKAIIQREIREGMEKDGN